MMKTKAYMLSTFDNPFNPHTHFREWYAYDEAAGYATSGLLARVCFSSEDLSEVEQIEAMNQAIQEVLDNDPTGFYIRVAEDWKPVPSKE